MTPADLELLTIQQLAGLAKQHRATLYRRIAEGKLHVIHLGPHTPRVTLEEAERYLHGEGVTIDPPKLTPIKGGKS